MEKKVVWLPYDMDTAIGINNEGSLVFSYNLEDIDHITGGADVFNGQDSVIWNNIRDAFGDELAAMYQTLRSTGALSYDKVEQMFEEHQDKWPEAIFNEDAWFKYIDPLVIGGTGAYLAMLQGSKAEQRKWWLYNRFRYIDSKYNAGDALNDLIQIRGYAKSNITVTPYADIYPSVKYGSYLVRARGERNVPTTLVCPLDNVNDTEIYIYSSSQLASVGDLSGFKVGFADFSMATKLQSVKIGDASSNYSNPNLKALTLGNNVLLKTLDVRNCTALGTGEQKTVDISGCEIIENVYFDGTAINGVTLPNGGVLKVLHLPATVTNLTIMNQSAITDLTVASYNNISTLRLENVPTVDMRTILNAVPVGTRVRLIGFAWECEDAEEIEDLLDLLDTMRGIDESGNNVETAQVSGSIHTSTLTGAQIASYQARYPYIEFRADHTSAVLSYYNGNTLITTQTIIDGGDGSYSGTTPTKAQDAQYTYTFSGWSKGTNDNTVDADALLHVVGDRNVYACYSGTLRTYDVTFVRAAVDGGGTLYTQNNVPYGTLPTYGGSTPTTTQGDAEDYPFEGWTPPLAPVDGTNLTYTAKFGSPIEVTEIADSWDTIIANIDNGTYSTKYKVGNYKPLDLSTEGIINMQIVAMDADELADRSGYAPLTFVGMELLTTKRTVDVTDVGNFKNAALNTVLNDTIYNLIPNNVRLRVQTVTKTLTVKISEGSLNPYYTYTTKVFIPSCREIDYSISKESSGVQYTKLYSASNASSLIKHIVGGTTPNAWWLRSAGSSSMQFMCVSGSGNVNGNRGNNSLGICLGFCLGAEQETISDS